MPLNTSNQAVHTIHKMCSNCKSGCVQSQKFGTLPIASHCLQISHLACSFSRSLGNTFERFERLCSKLMGHFIYKTLRIGDVLITLAGKTSTIREHLTLAHLQLEDSCLSGGGGGGLLLHITSPDCQNWLLCEV